MQELYNLIHQKHTMIHSHNEIFAGEDMEHFTDDDFMNMVTGPTNKTNNSDADIRALAMEEIYTLLLDPTMYPNRPAPFFTIQYPSMSTSILTW